MEFSYPIQLYDLKNKADFLDWRKVILAREISELFLDWLYLNCPYGKVRNYIAFDEKKIIAQYSTLPLEFYYCGEKCKTSLCFDVSTHPDYRNKGLFVKLGFYALENEKKINVTFTIGFPNDKAVPGHKKVGWYFLGNRPILENRNPQLLSIPADSNFTIKQINFFDEKYNIFMQTHKNILPIIQNRSQKYLNWRYASHPNAKYLCYEVYSNAEFKGYFIGKLYQDIHEKKLHIVDFLLDDNEHVFNSVLMQMIKITKSENVNLINIMVNFNLSFAKYLRSKSFTEAEHSGVLIAHNNTEQVDSSFMKELINYYITFGDTDNY